MLLCQWLNRKYILTGHSITNLSLFDKCILKSAIKKALYVSTRDGGISQKNLKEINIASNATCDDALLLRKMKYNHLSHPTSTQKVCLFQIHNWNVSPKSKKKIFDAYCNLSKTLIENNFLINIFRFGGDRRVASYVAIPLSMHGLLKLFGVKLSHFF